VELGLPGFPETEGVGAIYEEEAATVGLALALETETTELAGEMEALEEIELEGWRELLADDPRVLLLGNVGALTEGIEDDGALLLVVV
jgi:hypothetical protein